MRFATTAVSCGLLLLSAAATAHAGPPQERKGFWIAFGFGYGWADTSCSICEGESEGGGTGVLRLGWTLNPHILLGGEFNVWYEDGDFDELYLYDALATVSYYPVTSSGFFLRGGIGGAWAEQVSHFGNTTVTTQLGDGLGLMAGAGYDIRLGRKFSITPAVTYWTGRGIEYPLDDVVDLAKRHQNIVDLTVAFTFH